MGKSESANEQVSAKIDFLQVIGTSGRNLKFSSTWRLDLTFYCRSPADANLQVVNVNVG